MALEGPFHIAPHDVEGAPADVVAAIALLQQHGFCVLRSDPTVVKAWCEIAGAEVAAIASSGSPLTPEQTLRDLVARRLGFVLGGAVLDATSVSRVEDPANQSIRYDAVLYVARSPLIAGLNGL